MKKMPKSQSQHGQSVNQQGKVKHCRPHRLAQSCHDFQYAIRSLAYTLKIYHQAVGRRSIFNVFYNVFTAVVPSITAVLAGLVVTEVVQAVTTRTLVPAILLLLVLFIIKAVESLMDEIYSLYQFKVNQDVTAHITKQIALKYFRVPLNIRETQEFADLLERVKEYSNMISFTSNNALNILSGIVGLITVFVTLSVISPLITLVIVLSVIPGCILSVRSSIRRQQNWRKHTKDRRVAHAIERKMTESNAALEVELHDLSGYFIRKLIKHLRSSEEQDLADAKRLFWPSIGSELLANLAEFIVLIFVAFEILAERLAIGQFLTIRNLLNQLSTDVRMLFTNLSTINERLVNAVDYHKFMHLPEQEFGILTTSKLPRIEFSHVSFSYPGNSTPTLDDLSFIIEPGDKIAIVGENGAGKTTLLKLLIGAYRPNSGEILIDGQPVDQLNRSEFLSKIGFLRQEFSRYEFASLGQNVWFGDISRDYDESAIRRALHKAGLDELEQRYPKGLDQILSKDFDSESPADLSGGQWQRLAIARAFFRSPPILILDEPTSAVDAKSEYEIFREIMTDQADKTTIIVSHRFSTVRKASKILVLDHGKIIEQGSHATLMKHDGLYKEMFSLQAEGYI